jgi:excisionase family DNA binding protein
MSKEEEYISTAEAAKIANVSEKTIRNWLEAGDITRYKSANRVRVNKGELIAFITPKVDK